MTENTWQPHFQKRKKLRMTCVLFYTKGKWYKNYWFISQFCVKPLQSIFFTFGALNSDTDFSTEILDPYLASGHFTERKVDSHTQAAPNIHKHCPTVESINWFS